MGYLTTFTIYNDAASSVKRNPLEFAEKINSLIATREPDEFGLPGCGSVCLVQQTRHADEKTIYVNAGNCVTEVNSYSRGFKDLIKKNPDFARELIEFLESELPKLKDTLLKETPYEKLSLEDKRKLARLEETPETLDRLSYDGDVYVRREVSCNRDTPPKILDRLSYDEDSAVRYNVALNPNTTPETLERLSHDEHVEVREHVAMNRNTFPKTLEGLSYDKVWCVRYWVAGNPNTSQKILDRLSYDENSKVSHRVAQQTLSEKSKE